MANKFAGLDGVVSDQPDTFETTEVEPGEGLVPTKEAESDVAVDPQELEQSSIDAAASARRFRGARVTDGVAKTEYEMPPDGARYETLEEKFNRLQYELREFTNQVTAAQASAAAGSAAPESTVQLAAQASTLNAQLQQVKLDQIIGLQAVSAKDVPGLQSDLAARLVSELGKFKAEGGAASAAGSTGDDKGDVVTYELYYRPEQAKHQQAMKAVALERRLHALEKLVGNESVAAVANFLDVPDVTLKSAVVQLAKRVDALSKQKMEELDFRFHTITKQYDELKKKKASLTATESAETSKKIDELYELVKKWDGVASCVPDVVDRLSTLRTLHEQAAHFSKTLTHLDTVQQQLRDELATQSVSLKTVEESFQKNFKTIEANFAALDKRINALKK